MELRSCCPANVGYSRSDSRVQEAAALHFEDFDFGRNRITINKKIQWPRARGFETKLVDGAKTNGGKTLPMGTLAAKIFKEWVLKSGVRSGLLFHIDGEILSYRQIEYRYTQALKRAGLPFRATHLLRHASLTEFNPERPRVWVSWEDPGAFAVGAAPQARTYADLRAHRAWLERAAVELGTQFMPVTQKVSKHKTVLDDFERPL